MAEGVRKRGNKWSYYFDVAKIDGKRKKIEKGGFRTQKEALEARTAAIAEYNNTGIFQRYKDISVADYLDYWLENAIKKNIGSNFTNSTYNSYLSHVKQHLKPTFGMYRLSALQYHADIIQEWIDNLKQQGLSRGAITNLLCCLSGALQYAVLPLKYIQNNPCSSVKIGKMAADTRAKERREYILSQDTFNKILNRFPEEHYLHLALLVPYNIGTRIGETFAIDLMSDIDFEKHEIHINRQMQRINKKWFVKPPKYDSCRTIKTGDTVERALQKAITERKKNMFKYGKDFLKTYITDTQELIQCKADVCVPNSYKEVMPLCTRPNGKLATPTSFQVCTRIIQNELNYPFFHSHCLRHTHGTILAENGVNPKTVMERLGHKNIETTLQTYIFNTDTMQQYAVDVFEKAVNN